MGKKGKKNGNNGAAEKELDIPDNVTELFKAAQNKRAQSCHDEIAEVLKKWNCSQVPIIVQNGGPPVPVNQVLRLPVDVGVFPNPA